MGITGRSSGCWNELELFNHTKMKYCKLEEILVDLESTHRNAYKLLPPPLLGNASKAVVPGPNNLQFFVLDGQTFDSDLPVIVTVGVNYTQRSATGKDPELPKNNKCKSSPVNPAVSYDLGDSRQRLVTCLDDFHKTSQRWIDNGLASPASVKWANAWSADKPSFHMVMTNFCGWITECEWTSLNKIFGRMISLSLLYDSSNEFRHLHDFTQRLQVDQPVLWVAHGLDSEVPPLARRFFNDHEIDNWIITPNLGSWRKVIRWTIVNGLNVVRFGGR
jgi:hypothetical protein